MRKLTKHVSEPLVFGGTHSFPVKAINLVWKIWRIEVKTGFFHHAQKIEHIKVRDRGPPRQQTPAERRPIPTVRDNVEALSDRFMDRTIPQAVTLLLREEGGPLHVNELYNRLLEGGFRFTGQNPTISVAVSLNRNTRFRKVAPGTFDLVMRDASKAS